MKLLATALNNLALAFVIAGFVASAVGGQLLSGGWHLWVAVAWGMIGVVLHFAGQLVLGG